jgi:transposase
VLLELTVAEQRFNDVMEMQRDGLIVVEVAERYGASRQAVHGWLRRYGTGGLDALADRSPGLAAYAWWNDHENDRCAPQPSAP